MDGRERIIREIAQRLRDIADTMDQNQSTSSFNYFCSLLNVLF